jgi:thiol-disulfide isomerase/thioredoxin
LGCGALLALVSVWAGFRLHASRQQLSQPATAAAPRLATGVDVPAGQASAPLPSDADPLPEPTVIPDHLPEVRLIDRTGKPESIDTWRGKSLVINFWATWCAPCRHEIPFLETLDAEWRAKDVQVVGIAVDQRAAVAAYADKWKITYPLLIGEEDALDAARAFGVTEPAFPFTVFTDRRGEVVALFMGELHAPQAALILSQVEALNQNRQGLGEARRVITEGLRALQAGKPG